MTDLNESPVLMLLDPSPPAQSRDLPVRLFESGALLPLRPRPVAMSDTTSHGSVCSAPYSFAHCCFAHLLVMNTVFATSCAMCFTSGCALGFYGPCRELCALGRGKPL